MVHEIALTIKPTMNCNMRCRHCFNGDDLNISGILDIEKVYWFIESACKEYQDVKITFHGGEPTLAGLDYYKKIYAFQDVIGEKYKVKFSNNFTTNAVLLNDELMDLLISHNTLINISFDGPYNDFLRRNSALVYERICAVKEKGGRVRAFCTISRGSYEHLLDIYKWFNERSIDFKILPIEPRGYAAVDQELLMDTDDFIRILTDTYRYWITDQSCQIRFYTFEEFVALRRDTQFKPFWFSREIALNPDGKIYPFGRPNDIQFCLGEPSADFSLTECFSASEYSRMLQILNDYRNGHCTNCASTRVCNGVCICMSYMYVKEPELLRYSCNQSNKIFNSILDVNDEIMQDIKEGRADKYTSIVRKKFGLQE